MHRERNQEFRETGNLKHLHRNKLNKVCFAYDLAKKTISDKLLNDKAYGIARNRGYDGYLRALASMVY